MGEIEIRRYLEADRSACLTIFDANTPEFFAHNERQDYVSFLNSVPPEYRVCISAGSLVGSFGVFPEEIDCARLNWILLDPAAQGRGLGSTIMAQALADAASLEASALLIAASHKSAPFFEKFGATAELTIEHGWGADMHRVDMRLNL